MPMGRWEGQEGCMPERMEKATVPDNTALETLVSIVYVQACYPVSGLAQFWVSPEQPVDCDQHMADDVHDELRKLTQKLIIFDGILMSLPQSAIELEGIDTQSEYFQEMCHEFETE